MPRPDHLHLVEAAYDVERDEPRWLDGLIDAAAPLLEGGLGVGAYLYDASSRPMRTWGHAVRAGLDLVTLERGCLTFDEDYRRANWLCRRFGTLSEFKEVEAKVSQVEMFAKLGIRDVVALNALDPSGRGYWIAAPQIARKEPSKGERARWSRVAAHVAAALRLRARLQASVRRDPEAEAEAILAPSGRVEEARGEAESAVARKALREAALDVERARGELRRDDLDRALGAWPALVRGRWTLVDHFETGGRRYVLAYTNTSEHDDVKLLSPREREVVERAALGHENKLIAYELGLAPSTVRVLMRRAAAKLGARSREAALEAFAKLKRAR